MVGDELQSIYGFRHADLDVFRAPARADRRARRRRADGAERQLPLPPGGDRRRQPLRRGAARRRATGRCGSAPPPAEPAPRGARPGGRAAADRARRLGRGGDRAGAGDRRPHPAQLPGRGARRRRAPARARRRRASSAARWSCCCAPSPTSTPTRTRSSAPACAPTWSAAAATGPSSRSPTSARCWRRSPTRSTTRRSSAPSPRPPAAPPRTRSGCCGRRPGSGATSGRRWSAAAGAGEAELAEPERLAQIPEAELELLRRFVATTRGPARARRRGSPLAALIEAAVTETGYDLAVLMRPAGEARFANVRKLMRLAAEFEAREGRDLRGLLDFLAARAESDAEAQAATAAEGHDGVRIMTVHNAKGLEFDVVAVPDLSRSLLAGARPPLLALGREQPPRVGMQLRRLGAASINLYDYAELCEEAKRARLRGGPAALPRRRDPGPRAADPQRRRQTRAGARDEAGHAGDRAPGRGARGRARRRRDASRVPPPRAAPGPRGELRRLGDRGPRQPALARARRRAARRRAATRPPTRAARRGPAAAGRAPARRSSPAARSPTPRSPPTRNAPTASTWSGCWASAPPPTFVTPQGYKGEREPDEGAATPSAREERQRPGRRRPRAARVEPGERVARALGGAGAPPRARRRPRPGADRRRRRCWRRCAAGSARRCCASGSPAATRVRAEVPILLGVGGTVLRGSIDLLVEREGEPPLVVDYKTDRLGGAEPGRARRPLRDPALDLRPRRRRVARRAPRSRSPTSSSSAPRSRRSTVSARPRWTPAASALDAAIARIGSGEFPAAAGRERDWDLCRGCPALGRLCSGPRAADRQIRRSERRVLRTRATGRRAAPVSRPRRRASPPARRASAPSAPRRPRRARPAQ